MNQTFIQNDAEKRKILSLLKNTMMLNHKDDLTDKQVLIICEGLGLLRRENVSNKDFWLLSHKFDEVGLITMPSWE